MGMFPTPEEAMRDHRNRKVYITEVKPGDQVEIAGWPAMVAHSEPWSDHVWFLELDGHYANGDKITTSVKVPSDVKVFVRRKPRERK